MALSKYKKKDRKDVICIDTLCDSRHATSKRRALRLLKERNAQGEYENNPEDTFPRAVIWHRADGVDMQLIKLAAERAPILRPAPNQIKE